MKLPEQLKNVNYITVIKSPFFYLSVAFLVWISFFDSYSWLEHLNINKEIKKLEENKAYFENEIQKDKKAIKGLKNGDATEKYAREKYYMKRENEDIYIIELDTIQAK
ncbi:MAG: septum formation initiator family protein [Flavobacteriaceae bacterium]|jgi:cell division protein FtsB|nr:septum formation initiator family protein [Flavobacteriaceae bacterium]